MEPDHREPVTSLSDLRRLDVAEMLEGYKDGREGWACGDNRSRSYWHGWRNGQVDGGHAKPDAAQIALARACRHVNLPALEILGD